MTEFLRFTIFAPTASWGDHAVGEIRGSWDRPSRSAILGLVAAALGFHRGEDDAHAKLDSSLAIAVRVLAAGQPLIDYHTTQNPTDRAMRSAPGTRRAALELDEPTATLSRRWLRQDALFFVALWSRPSATISLAEVIEALNRPRYSLYAGRKANALALPLHPDLIEARTLADALRTVPDLPEGFDLLMPGDGWGTEVAYDTCEGFDAALLSLRTVTRRDGAPVRSRWQFSERVVNVGVLAGGSTT